MSQVSSKQERVDIRLPGLDRLARALTDRVRQGSQPYKAVMREKHPVDAKTNENNGYNTDECGNNASSGLVREPPSLSEECKERQAVPSTCKPSSVRRRAPTSDPSKGVPVYVMLPLDTVSSPHPPALLKAPFLTCKNGT